jgi:hypothetical protein
MTRTWILVVGTVVTAGSIWIGLTRSADPPKATPTGEDVFAGKVLVVHCRSHFESGAVLEKVQIRNLGGKSFLVGKGADDGQPDNWHKGHVVWIAVDDVAQMVEFADLEQFKKAATRFKR